MKKPLIVHDWIEKVGGAEQVLLGIADIFPDSKIYTLWNESESLASQREVIQSPLNKLPKALRRQFGLPFMPSLLANAFSVMSDEDFVLTTSHLFAHHFGGARLEVPKFSYIHTPARYFWAPGVDARASNGALKPIAQVLKSVDKKAARTNVSLAANSFYVQRRIKETWKLDAEVIYPPVNTVFFNQQHDADQMALSEHRVLAGVPDEYLIAFSRFVSYKRLDLAIHVAAELNMPLVICGSGPEEQDLRRLAASSPFEVTFVLSPSDVLLRALFQRATALVFPGVEDFGLVPVEAQAAGIPVIARNVGGVRETVTHGSTGFLCEEFDKKNLTEALRVVKKINKEDCVAKADQFSQSKFRLGIENWILAYV